MAGYSGTPLATKLGIKPGFMIFTYGAPKNYAALLAPLPDDVTFFKRLIKAVDLIHIFTTSAEELYAKLRIWDANRRADLGLLAEEGVEGADGHHRGRHPQDRAADGICRREGLRGRRDLVGVEAGGEEGDAVERL